jgi:hypothetical protein
MPGPRRTPLLSARHFIDIMKVGSSPSEPVGAIGSAQLAFSRGIGAVRSRMARASEPIRCIAGFLGVVVRLNDLDESRI